MLWRNQWVVFRYPNWPIRDFSFCSLFDLMMDLSADLMDLNSCRVLPSDFLTRDLQSARIMLQWLLLEHVHIKKSLCNMSTHFFNLLANQNYNTFSAYQCLQYHFFHIILFSHRKQSTNSYIIIRLIQYSLLQFDGQHHLYLPCQQFQADMEVGWWRKVQLLINGEWQIEDIITLLCHTIRGRCWRVKVSLYSTPLTRYSHQTESEL